MERSVIVGEEKNAALVIKRDTQNLSIYVYQYDYYDTINYYSGHRNIKQMTDDQLLDKPFFLVVAKPYMDWHSFPDSLAAHLTVEYKGITLILYKFAP